MTSALKKEASSRTICSPRRRGTPDGIRTHDLQSRSLALYPAELRAHIQKQLVL